MNEAEAFYDGLAIRIPTVSNFAVLRQRNAVYVDKTDLLFDIANDYQFKMICRPRRFGKSTVVSALKELFEHGVEPYDGHESYFAGLKIEKLWTEPAGRYHVMALDFSLAAGFLDSAQDFCAFVHRQLADYAHSCGVTITPGSGQDFALTFRRLFDALAADRKEFVLLLDEYDYAMTHCAPEQEQDMLSVVRSFFLALKVFAHKFRKVFVTGITRTKDSSVFTAGSVIADLSESPLYGNLCGFTAAEVRQYFRDNLRYAASVLYDMPLQEVGPESDAEMVFGSLVFWYYGYCFDSSCRQRVFNPWSLLQFFSNPLAEFSRYWQEQAGMPPALKQAMAGILRTPAGLRMPEEGVVTVNRTEFDNPGTMSTMHPAVLLYQTGYLTLGELPEDCQPVRLLPPDGELRQFFRNNLPQILHDLQRSGS